MVSIELFPSRTYGECDFDVLLDVIFWRMTVDTICKGMIVRQCG